MSYTGDEISAYEQRLSQLNLPDEDYEIFNLEMSDDRLLKMLVDSLHSNRQHWNKAPWKLEETDKDNMRFLLGEQVKKSEFQDEESEFVDNRLFAATRAILSYATGQLAVPELTPSRNDKTHIAMARSMQMALYQHSLDEKVEQKVRAAVLNLIVRKRGFLKQRYDPHAGAYGDIITEVVSPEDIIIDRNAKFMDNPNVIYQRLRCSVDELCVKFPKKEKEIKQSFSIKQGRYTQMSRLVTYFEAWFTYLDTKGVPREGVCWFLPDNNIILDKMPNPNWIYTGDDKEDKQQNVTANPPKPYTSFNYLNLGHSFIDETSLFDQAKPQQIVLNKRGKQILLNADYVNGRWVYSTKALSDEDAARIVNKGPTTMAGVDSEDVNKAIANIQSAQLPPWVYNTMLDARNEIDTMMGTPAVFRGEQPSSQDTLGRDLMVKQQAGALQDDLVRCVQSGMEGYYKLKLQMMRVYYTDDYWFQAKGGDGKFDFVMLNGDNIDANVRIGVQVDSTLPLDKERIRATAMELAKAGRIDDLTLFEDLGLPDPEIRAERLMRSRIDPIGYMDSIATSLDNTDAEIDIRMVLADKEPEERDTYDEGYMSYINGFLESNRFEKIKERDAAAAQRLISFITVIQDKANRTANLQALNQSGMLPLEQQAPPGAAPGMDPGMSPEAPPGADPGVI